MDLLAQLCDPEKKLEYIVIPSAQVDGAMDYGGDSDFTEEEEEEEEENGQEYVKQYQEKEALLYAEAIEEQAGNTLNDINSDIISSGCVTEVQRLHLEHLNEVFHKYDFDKRTDPKQLTIYSYRERILNMIHINEVVIIEGPTGCGKTTQVPQFILDECKAKNKLCNIVVTQPRRIAAISVARRVCEERGWGLGTICGYQVGLEKTTSSDTVLAYVTTGVLLQKLIHNKNLHEYTHIIIDEVHERNQDMDFLLLVIRKFLFMNSLNIKVILMSATFDTDEFAVYFRNYSRKEIIPAPVIRIVKPNIYNTTMYYSDQLKGILPVPENTIDKPQIDDKAYKLFIFLVRALDRLDNIDKDTNNCQIGSVLVFLPGILEIEEAYTRLQENKNEIIFRDTASDKPLIEWHILPLHSSITTDEQRKVFLPAPAGHRKIILSTNIAESSITVSDICYVIDFCLTKTMVVDPHTKYQSLQLEWASHVNCTQRAGRVGRIADGRVYRLVSEDFYENEMPKMVIPEILRAPLDRVVLASKMLNLAEPPKAILALALNPPDLKNIQSTIWSLKDCGALTVKRKGKTSPEDGELTFLGTVMAQLPIDVNLAKFIVLGHMFSCLKDTIIMAAGSSLNNIFSTPFQERAQAYKNKLMWSDASCSDLIALLNLYKVWERNKRTNSFNVGTGSGEAGWLKQNFVSRRALLEWQHLIRELTDRLERLGIRESTRGDRVVLDYMETPSVLKVVMCGAFYPNYFIRAADAGQVDEREAVKKIDGKDPFRTVYFTNMDQEQPGALYAGMVKKIFTGFSQNMRVSFKNQKVFVQFVSTNEPSIVNVDGNQFLTSMPGKVLSEVYQAVRLRQLGMRTSIAVLPTKAAWKRADELGIGKPTLLSMNTRLNRSSGEEPSILPSLIQEWIPIEITEIIDAGHFWAQNRDDSVKESLFMLEKLLNEAPLQVVNEKVKVNEVYAAKFSQDNLYYRCKVMNIKPGRPPIAQILFIDYGNTQSVAVSQLCHLPEPAKLNSKQPQAMECELAGIKPTLVFNPKGFWSQEANKAFYEMTSKQRFLTGKVYSVVDGVVHMELYASNQSTTPNGGQYVSINELLIRKQFAEPAEESYLSKDNNLRRKQVQKSDHQMWEFSNEEINDDEVEVESPHINECCAHINLKGPYSPLEMQIYGLTHSSHTKNIRIEGSSVNTVLLDTEPQDPHARLLVAAQIGQTPEGEALKLRHTTVLPNIPGLVALVSLIFCPRMEPKPTADGSRIAGVLCGLGAWEDTRKPLYPAHDMIITLDTELLNEELERINNLRYWMNQTIETMQDLMDDNVKPKNSVETCQGELKKRLFELLRFKRKSVERAPFKYQDVWNMMDYNAEILKTSTPETDRDIWPLHWSIELNNSNQHNLLIKDNLKKLSEMAQRMIPFEDITCEICKKNMRFLHEVRLHLASQSHRSKVEELQ